MTPPSIGLCDILGILCNASGSNSAHRETATGVAVSVVESTAKCWTLQQHGLNTSPNTTATDCCQEVNVIEHGYLTFTRRDVSHTLQPMYTQMDSVA